MISINNLLLIGHTSPDTSSLKEVSVINTFSSMIDPTKLDTRTHREPYLNDNDDLVFSTIVEVVAYTHIISNSIITQSTAILKYTVTEKGITAIREESDVIPISASFGYLSARELQYNKLCINMNTNLANIVTTMYFDILEYINSSFTSGMFNSIIDRLTNVNS